MRSDGVEFAGTINASRLPSRLMRVPGRRSFRIEVIDPVDIGGKDDIGRRAGLDLLCQRVACSVRDDDFAACLGLEPADLLVQRLLETGCGEDGKVGGARRLDRQSGKGQADRDCGCYQQAPHAVSSCSHAEW